MSTPLRIAIIGAGVSGLGCAWLLHQRYSITVYEAEPRLGGHVNTVSMPWDGGIVPVDAGFIVYNQRNYPEFTRLLGHLDVPTRPSKMTFGVSIDGGRLEYAGSMRALLAGAANLVRPGFGRMVLDIRRFARDGACHLATHQGPDLTLGEFLERRGYSQDFHRHYLLPLGAAIWSSSTSTMLAFPARTFLGFFADQGLLSLRDRPRWRTVSGGARVYVNRLSQGFRHRVRLGTPVRAVRRLAGGVEVLDAHGGRRVFDHVVLGCHADEALALIEQPTAAERAILGSFRYQTNRAILHRDPALMPKRRSVWSSWNYLACSGDADRVKVSLTYWLNRLQGIERDCLALVSLNPLQEPAPETVVAEFAYDHPQYERQTLAARARQHEIQGHDRLWFCGAHWGYGFHEDGLRSGFEVASRLGVAPPWWERRFMLRSPGAARSLPERAAAQAE